MNIVTSDKCGFIKLKRFYDNKVVTLQRLGKITRNADPMTCQFQFESVFFFGSQNGDVHIKQYDKCKLNDIISFNARNYIEESPMPELMSKDEKAACFDAYRPFFSIQEILFSEAQKLLILVVGGMQVLIFNFDLTPLISAQQGVNLKLSDILQFKSSFSLHLPETRLMKLHFVKVIELQTSQLLCFHGRHFFDVKTGRKIGQLLGPDYRYLEQFWPRFEISALDLVRLPIDSNAKLSDLEFIQNKSQTASFFSILSENQLVDTSLFDQGKITEKKQILEKCDLTHKFYEVLYATTNDGHVARYEGFCFYQKLSEIPPYYYKQSQQQHEEQYRITAQCIKSISDFGVRKEIDNQVKIVRNDFLHRLFIVSSTFYLTESAESQNIFNFQSKTYLNKMKSFDIDYEKLDIVKFYNKYPGIIHFIAGSNGYCAGFDGSAGILQRYTIRQHYGSVKAIVEHNGFIVTGGSEKYLRFYKLREVDGRGRDGIIAKEYNIGDIVGLSVFDIQEGEIEETKSTQNTSESENSTEEEEAETEDENEDENEGFNIPERVDDQIDLGFFDGL